MRFLIAFLLLQSLSFAGKPILYLMVDQSQRSSKQLVRELKRDWMMDSRGVLTVLDCHRAATLNEISDSISREYTLKFKNVHRLPGFTPRYRFSRYGEWRKFDRRMFLSSSWALRGVRYVIDTRRHSENIGAAYHVTAQRFVWGLNATTAQDVANALEWRDYVEENNVAPVAPWD